MSTPSKRLRWATQRVKSLRGQNKRLGIKDRFQKGAKSSDKKRESGGTDSTSETRIDDTHEGSEILDGDGEQMTSNRKIFFNIPLPLELTDEDGNNLANFGRNKIRTSKYTPLTFVPKNLWYQFHNIANVYFLFLIILTVRTSPVNATVC